MPGQVISTELPTAVDKWQVRATIEMRDGKYIFADHPGLDVHCLPGGISGAHETESTTARIEQGIRNIVKDLNGSQRR